MEDQIIAGGWTMKLQPLPNHCIECDKPIVSGTICDYCRLKKHNQCSMCNCKKNKCLCKYMDMDDYVEQYI